MTGRYLAATCSWFVALTASCVAAEAVFRAGTEGHHTYRIPALVRVGERTLLALAEGRRDNMNDPGGGHINLVYKISPDGGKTWSALRFLDRSREGWAASNPTAVVDRRRGRVFVFFNRWKPGRGSATSRIGQRDNQVWMRYSDDGGRHWSEPVDLTAAVRAIDRWSSVVCGPGSGIQLSSGRLLVPVYGQRPRTHSVWRAAFAVFSDDGGKTWHRGKWVDVNCNENQMVELDDGRVLVDARQEGGTTHRWVAESHDAGGSWREPRAGISVTPVCTSLVRYRPEGAAGSWYVWSGPRGPGRMDLVLRISTDQCRSFGRELLIGPGPAAYSNLAVLQDGCVAVLWEAGQRHAYETIRFAVIPRQMITRLAAKGAGP